MESRNALERRDLRLWCQTTGLFGSSYHALDHVRSQGSPGGGLRTESPERMVHAAPTFGLTSSEKRTLDLVTDHPMIPREHFATWLGVSEGPGQPDDAQPREYLGPCRVPGATR